LLSKYLISMQARVVLPVPPSPAMAIEKGILVFMVCFLVQQFLRIKFK
jgi:hypothetical protein